MHTYRVYYSDGNQKLFESATVTKLLWHLQINDSDVDLIVKIEEVTE